MQNDHLRYRKIKIPFAYKLVLSIIILITCFTLRQWLDFFFILTATALVLMAELFNSAIEALCDFVEISKNEKIKVIKAISAPIPKTGAFIARFLLTSGYPGLMF
jgi:diacylglycerol kinase